MNEFPARINRVNISEAVGGSKYSATLTGPAAEHSSSKLFRNIKGIIFDFDGTLFDNALIALRLIAAYPPDMFRLWRERLVRKQFAGSDYAGSEEYYEAFFKALGKACSRSPERIKAWYCKRFIPRMIKVLKKHYRLRPGVKELFELFERNAKTAPGIAVYSDYPSLKERLEGFGLSPGPKVLLYGPESFGAQKPSARPFKLIAGDLGVAPEEVLVIGDREDTDGLGAFRAGMRFFCLEMGHNKHYFRLDPYGRPENDKPNGPSLVMYAGAWDDLVKLLTNHFFRGKA